MATPLFRARVRVLVAVMDLLMADASLAGKSPKGFVFCTCCDRHARYAGSNKYLEFMTWIIQFYGFVNIFSKTVGKKITK
jgi:hypothetical protein